MLNDEGKVDFSSNKGQQLVLTLNFADLITLKGIMVTNSKDINRAFDKISKIQVEYFADGKICRATTLKFCNERSPFSLF